MRIHFTAEDLARTQVADGADPLWETVLSLHSLQERCPDPVLAGRRTAALTRPLSMLLPLVPPRGYFPDFLTPGAGTAGLDAGLDAVLSTPRARLRTELTRLTGRNRPAPWTRSLADGEPGSLRRLAGSLREYHNTALGPQWARITRRTATDRALRLHALWQGGAEAMLRTYGPSMRWQSPVLEVDYPVDRDLHLDGRGLLLVPSYFCKGPVALADQDLPPVLVYAASADGKQGVPEPPASLNPCLAKLIGHTRAAVLEALSSDCTTTELAQRAGVALSTASEHATVLRSAGLVSSVRQRNVVRHALTPLGTALLRSN
ncbi:ArsR/SmtB family transcription factor [Streptomyces triticagri]|nr:winged helix-turn-helix domain-containing protein [Streptomyces triticagri]